MVTPLIYLDYAAATPVDERVIAAMQPFWQTEFYNPSATYREARGAADELETARAKMARRLGARPAEIIFTAGGTEANNLAVHGVMQRYPEGNVVVSAVEHESVLAPAHRYECREVAVLPDGTIDVQKLQATIDEHTVLVSVMYANNEIGTVEPLSDITELVKRIRSERRQQGNKLPLYFHTDAAQAANYLDLHVSRLGVDIMTLNGGKIYGPKQSGVLYVGAHVELEPILLGGGQERGIRSGTENVAQAIGLAAALDIAQDMRHEETKRLQGLQAYFFEGLEATFPDAVINGSRKKRLPNNVHVTLPGQDNERLLFALDEAGIMAAAGSACSASDEEPSHVLRAMGIGDAEARASLRFTMGRTTTKDDIDTVISGLSKIVQAS